MRKQPHLILLLFTFSLSFVVPSCRSETTIGVGEFPSKFPSWKRVKTNIIPRDTDESSSYNEIYVNDLGYGLYREGGDFPDGTVWVRANYELEKTGTRMARGEVTGYMVMKKVKGAFETDGWVYEEYDEDGRPLEITNPSRACHNCHKSTRSQDFVFSKF